MIVLCECKSLGANLRCSGCKCLGRGCQVGRRYEERDESNHGLVLFIGRRMVNEGWMDDSENGVPVMLSSSRSRRTRRKIF